MSTLPDRYDSDKALAERNERLTYDFYAKARGSKKRNFIYSYDKARTCNHSHLVATAMGVNTYKCLDCNWVFTIVTTYAEPLHLFTVKAAYQLLHFAKEHGVAALNEVLRQPHGQHDGTPHKGAIPDGMTLFDAALALEEVNVNSPDGGSSELRQLVETIWPSDREIERRIKALRGSDAPGKKELADQLQEILEVRRGLRAAEEPSALPPNDSPLPPVPKDGP